MARQKIAQERATGEVSLARLNQERNSLQQRQIEIRSSISNAQKEFKQVETEQQKTVITSPESGTILKLELRNSGQVLRPGEPIAQISPSNAPLVIKARVSAEDVGKVQVCQATQVTECTKGKVQMRVSAYPYPDYGTLKGAVRAITADAITPQNNGNAPATPYYELTIEPENLDLQKGDKSYAIQPGM
ncbi:MAG: HlyD family efflux transporter periplasmic adaptor subunit [Heteroscytonema crispum UTEX LB 1556]